MKPTVGRVVHYVSFGTPGGEFGQECRAAIVTETPHHDHPEVVNLCVLNPSGIFFHENSPYYEPSETTGDPNCGEKEYHGNPFRYCSCGWSEKAPRGGSWHWPERVSDGEC